MVSADAYTIPTDSPEADGTFAWTSTTLIVVEVQGGGTAGLGYTYSDGSVAGLIRGKLAECVKGRDVMDPPAAWRAMTRAVRNMGPDGLAATAISAVDVALWDLKCKLLNLPPALLLGRARNAVPIYGSGGFTTYSDDQLRSQLAGWVENDGCRWVKMKVGTQPDRDPLRVAVAKRAIGDRTLFIDANGAYSPRRRCPWLNCSRRGRTCAGSRNRSHPTTCPACAPFANGCRCVWNLPPVSMVTTSTISAACWMPVPWMCSRRMRRGAGA
jgi:L-alanine-DL-glutamate epimerase-like enolase superfamily enzyme